jgi:NAD+ synthase (glutamine-hydrolysing)
MRIGMLQLNPTVGDITSNTNNIIESVLKMKADIILTPEMSICGYPPRDLLHYGSFIQACEEAVQRVAQACNEQTVLVGHPRLESLTGHVRNSVSVLRNGEIIAVADKQLLPSYDVFDEKRYFESGDQICTFELLGEKIGIAICEDFWRGFDSSSAPMYEINPVRQLLDASCSILVSPSASPFVTSKHQSNLEYALDLASEHSIVVAVCNQVGGNDDLVFDGGSFVVSSKGLLGKSPLFAVSDSSVSLKSDPIATENDICNDKELCNALVLGIKDYFGKTDHTKALLGISGGIDSALVATLAVCALGKEAITGVLMPSRYSSIGSIEDAEQLAKNLGITTTTLPIEYMHAAFEQTLRDSCEEASGLAEENAQARIRGLLLMALSNQQGSLLLATGNKSELAVGYSTMYGDMSGSVSVIGDIYKTDVWSMSNFLNDAYKSFGFSTPPIPESSISKPPSAELRPNQLDQDSLPSYEELDAVLRLHIDLDFDADEIEDEINCTPELISTIIRMVDIAQFKRDQAAVIFKTSPRTFGRGRRMPIVMKRNWASIRETT